MSYLPDAVAPEGDQMRELTLDAVGRLYSNGKFVFEQVSSAIALHSCEAGSGTIVVDGDAFTMRQGDLFTFFPGRHYRYFDSPESPWRYYWCRISGTRAIETLAMVGISQAKPLLTGNAALHLGPILKETADVVAGSLSAPFYPQAAAWRIVSAIAEAQPPETCAIPRSAADDARAIMDDDFAIGLSIDEIARRTGVSRSTLFRQFRDRYGFSPKDYLDSVRLNRAGQLLRQSDTPIHEIAALCGYDDSHYFSRAYKLATGCTPTMEREGAQKPTRTE